MGGRNKQQASSGAAEPLEDSEIKRQEVCLKAKVLVKLQQGESVKT